jgi:sugar phosphate isomerase/epimerase
MQFGICTSVDNSQLAKAAGWDFIEENCQNILQGLIADDAQWSGRQRAERSALPVLSANVLLPGSLKVTGADFDEDALATFLQRVVGRAKSIGIKTIVFGSAGSRNVPDGFDRSQAKAQIADFCTALAVIGAGSGIQFVVEHLRRQECNIINTVGEAMTYVLAVNQPSLRCVLDTYHLWSESEPLANVRDAMPWIKHVHLADLEGRVAPGLSGTSDYRPIFRILKDGNYDGLISVEAAQFDIANDGERVLAFIKTQWENA